MAGSVGSAPLYHKRSMTPNSPFRFRLFSADQTNNNNHKTHSRFLLHRTFSKSASLSSNHHTTNNNNMNEPDAPGSPVYTMNVNDNPFQLDTSQDVTDASTVSSISVSSIRRLADIACPDLDRPPPCAIFVRSVSTSHGTDSNATKQSLNVSCEEQDANRTLVSHENDDDDDNDTTKQTNHEDGRNADQQQQQPLSGKEKNHPAPDPVRVPPTASEWQRAWAQGGEGGRGTKKPPPPTASSSDIRNLTERNNISTHQQQHPVPITPSPVKKKKPPLALRRSQTAVSLRQSSTTHGTLRRSNTTHRFHNNNNNKSRQPQRPPTLQQRAVTDAAVLLGNRPRRCQQLPSNATVISFGSRVGQSTVLTPPTSVVPGDGSIATTTNGDKPDRMNFLKQDLEHFWKVVSQPVRRWSTSEETIHLRRNVTGCLT